MGPDKVGDSGEQNREDDAVEAVEPLLEAGVFVPLFAEAHADVSEGKAPWPGTDEGVNVEAQARHAGDSGGQSDKRANDGQKACEEDREGAPAGEEAVGEIEVVVGYKDVATIA